MTRFILPESRSADRLVQPAARLPEPLQPPLHPGTKEPVGPDDLAPLFPMALIEQEMTRASRGSTSRARCSTSCRLWRPTPLVRADAARGGARHAGAHLLQGRVGVAGRFAQAQHRGGAGLLQQAGGHTAPGHRDRRRAVGLGAVVRLRRSSASSARCTWCAASYEQKPYRRVMMETWGGEVVPSPVDDPTSPGSLGARDQRRGARRRRRATTRTTRSARCSTTCCCTRRSSASRRRSSSRWRGRRGPDVVIGSCGGGSNLGGIALPFMTDDATCGSWRSSRRRARRSPRARSSTTSATPPG